MNIYVCVKRVPDTEASIKLKNDKQIDAEAVGKWVVNPYDEYAIEEALKLKGQDTDIQVVLVSLGPENAQETIRVALSMGADRAIHIVSNDFLDHHYIAKALSEAIKQDGEYKLVFMGKQAIDDDSYQVHLRMARMLGASAATSVISFEFDGEKAIVSREIDEGDQEKIELKLPALIAATKGLNEPRLPSLRNIMAAKKKEIKKVSLEELGITGVENREEVLSLSLPEEKAGGKIIEGEIAETVPELTRLLKEEAKVI